MKSRAMAIVASGLALTTMIGLAVWLINDYNTAIANTLVSETWYVTYIIPDPPGTYIFSGDKVHYIALGDLGIDYGVDNASAHPEIPKLVHVVTDNKWKLLFKDLDQANRYLKQ